MSCKPSLLFDLEDKYQTLLAENREPKRLYIGTLAYIALVREIEARYPNVIIDAKLPERAKIRGLDVVKVVQDDYLEVE